MNFFFDRLAAEIHRDAGRAGRDPEGRRTGRGRSSPPAALRFAAALGRPAPFPLAAALPLGLPAPASAQITVTSHVGMNLATFDAGESYTFGTLQATATRRSSTRGVSAGMGVTYHPISMFGVLVSGAYAQKGSEIHRTVSWRDDDLAITTRLRYVEFMVLGRALFPLSGRTSVYLLAGPAFGFETACEASIDGYFFLRDPVTITESCGEGSGRSRTDFGLAAGVGVRARLDGKLGVSAGLLHTSGLTEVFEADEEAAVAEEGDTGHEAARNRVLTIRVGLTYRVW